MIRCHNGSTYRKRHSSFPLVVAFVFVIKYQSALCFATSAITTFSHVAFGIVSFPSSRSGVQLHHCGPSTAVNTTRGGGSDESNGSDGASYSNQVIISDKPWVNVTSLYPKRIQLTISWSDINITLQDFDKNISSLFRRSRKDILESVRNQRSINHDADNAIPPLDNIYHKVLLLNWDASKERDAENRGGNTPSLLDRISKSLALSVVLCTNSQVLGKLVSAAIVSNSDLAYEVASRILSPETNNAFKRIRSIIHGLEPEYGVLDIFSRYPPKDVAASVLALSRLQHASEYYNEMQTQEKKEYTSNLLVTPENNPQLLSDLAHYAVFANVAYGWKGGMAISGRFRLGNIQTLMKRTGVQEEDLVWAEWRSATHRPAYFIVRDKHRKNIVLSIRGTLSPKDILTDLCATADFFYAESLNHGNVTKVKRTWLLHRLFGIPKGRDRGTPDLPRRGVAMRAHQGMIQGAKEISKIAKEIVAQEMKSNPDFSLVLVGHSLGGGTAAVLGAMWKALFPDLIVYAYGCPCVFPLETEASLHSSIISVVGMHDPFSTLSLGHLADISKALSLLCEDEEKRDQVISRCATKPQDMNEEDLAWATEQMNIVRKSMKSEKLYPPGRILLISSPNQSKNQEEVLIEDVPKERFQEIMLHPRLFDLSRHVPNRYEDELRELWKKYSDTHETNFS